MRWSSSAATEFELNPHPFNTFLILWNFESTFSIWKIEMKSKIPCSLFCCTNTHCINIWPLKTINSFWKVISFFPHTLSRIFERRFGLDAICGMFFLILTLPPRMSFAGRLKIVQVTGMNLAVEDSIGKSSDPFFVFKYELLLFLN